MNASVIDRSNDILNSVRLHSKSVTDVLHGSDPRDDSGILSAEYVNLSRLPDTLPSKVQVVTDALSSDLLDSHVVELASSGDIVSPSANAHYYEDDFIDHALSEDDKKLAAALVAVQFVQQQKHQNSILAAELLGAKSIPPLSQFTTSAIDKPTISMVTSYIHSFDDTTQHILDPPTADRSKVFSQATTPLIPEDMDLKITNKSIKDDLDVSLEDHIINEIDSDYEIEGVKSSRRSLPHKKRIARKLKTQPQKNLQSNFYKCLKCGDTFSNQSEIFNHRSQHSNPSKKIMFSCELCAAQFCNQVKFFEHLKSHYEPKNSSQCENTQSEEMFSCSNDDQGNSLDNLVKTVCPQTRKSDSDSGISCEICGRTFKRQKAYESHKATVHSNTEEFSEPEDMMEGIRHVVNSQTASADDDSEDKLKSWRLSDDLSMSSDCCLSHQEDSPESPKGSKKKKVTQCPHCTRAFVHRNSLIYHIKSHSGLRPHQCEVCGKRFFAANALRVHLRLHSGDKPYKCEYCERRFRQWGDLKYHVISLHSNQKQYQCEFCGKDFARKYSLIVHRRIHTGEKNYVCEYCHKTFRASSYLMNHRRIHTGEKPYSCDVCQKPFRVKSDMKRHRSTHLKQTAERVNQASEITPDELPLQPEVILPETTSTPLNLNMRNDSTDSLTYSRDAFDREAEPNTLYVWLPTNGESILPD